MNNENQIDRKRRESIKAVMMALVDGFDKQNQETYEPLVDVICQRVGTLPDIESFHALVSYPASVVVDQAMIRMFPKTKDRNLRTAYSRWEDIYRWVGNLIESIRTDNGHPFPGVCVMDCGRYVANCYLAYKETGKVPVFTSSPKVYWMPEFGTGSEWMELCEGIVELMWHKPDRYIKAMAAMDKYREKRDSMENIGVVDSK